MQEEMGTTEGGSTFVSAFPRRQVCDRFAVRSTGKVLAQAQQLTQELVQL